MWILIETLAMEAFLPFRSWLSSSLKTAQLLSTLRISFTAARSAVILLAKYLYL